MGEQTTGQLSVRVPAGKPYGTQFEHLDKTHPQHGLVLRQRTEPGQQSFCVVAGGFYCHVFCRPIQHAALCYCPQSRHTQGLTTAKSCTHTQTKIHANKNRLKLNNIKWAYRFVPIAIGTFFTLAYASMLNKKSYKHFMLNSQQRSRCTCTRNPTHKQRKPCSPRTAGQ